MVRVGANGVEPPQTSVKLLSSTASKAMTLWHLHQRDNIDVVPLYKPIGDALYMSNFSDRQVVVVVAPYTF